MGEAVEQILRLVGEAAGAMLCGGLAFLVIGCLSDDSNIMRGGFIVMTIGWFGVFVRLISRRRPVSGDDPNG